MRNLPKPQARVAFAAIEDSDSFGSRWKAWRKEIRSYASPYSEFLANLTKIHKHLESVKRGV